jgi:hypothetical protein
VVHCGKAAGANVRATRDTTSGKSRKLDFI